MEDLALPPILAAVLMDIMEAFVLNSIVMMTLAKMEDLALPLILAAVLTDILDRIVLCLIVMEIPAKTEEVALHLMHAIAHKPEDIMDLTALYSIVMLPLVKMVELVLHPTPVIVLELAFKDQLALAPLLLDLKLAL